MTLKYNYINMNAFVVVFGVFSLKAECLLYMPTCILILMYNVIQKAFKNLND